MFDTTLHTQMNDSMNRCWMTKRSQRYGKHTHTNKKQKNGTHGLFMNGCTLFDFRFWNFVFSFWSVRLFFLFSFGYEFSFNSMCRIWFLYSRCFRHETVENIWFVWSFMKQSKWLRCDLSAVRSVSYGFIIKMVLYRFGGDTSTLNYTLQSTMSFFVKRAYISFYCLSVFRRCQQQDGNEKRHTHTNKRQHSYAADKITSLVLLG